MFDLQPPRHISTLRISSVAECPDQGPVTEPTADARPRGRGLLFLPQSSRSAMVSGIGGRREGVTGDVSAEAAPPFGRPVGRGYCKYFATASVPTFFPIAVP